MATKALPAAKVNPTKFLPSSTKKVSSANLVKMGKKDDESGELVVVHSKIIKIENLIKTNFKIEKDVANKKRIRTEKQKQQVKEDELEKKPEGDEKPGKKISLPRLSFLEKIKNFLFKMILGFVAIKLLPHLPKLLKFLPVLAAATEFVLDWAGKILNAIVTVVDWGYKLYDTFRGLVKNIFGEKGLEKFDALSKALNTVLNASLIVAMAMARMAPGMFGRGAASGQVFKRGGQTLLAKKGGKLTSTAAARKFALKHGRRAATRQVGSEGVKALGGKFARSQATNLARRGFMMVVGKQGAKNILRLVKPLVSKIPFIGGLLEFGLSWALGDPIGKAAFKGIGAGLGTWIGGLLGTLIPIPFVGTGIGMFLGGTGGSVLGGAIYDAIFGGKTKPSEPPTKVPDVEKMFGGGKTGRKLRTRSRRTSRKIRRSLPRVIPLPLVPGRDVGGEKKLDRMFPDTENYHKFKEHGTDSAWWDPLGVFTGTTGITGTRVTKTPMDPMGYIKDVYDKDIKTPFFGPLMGVSVKALSGTKPSKIDYWNIGKGLNAWVYDMFGDVELGYAGGGEARANMLLDGRDLSSIIARSVEKSVDRTVEDTINDLRHQLTLGKMGAAAGDSATGAGEVRRPGFSPTGQTYATESSGEYGDILDLISSVEAKSYDTINSGHIDGLSTMTIAGARRAALNAGYGSGAMGRYQQMPDYVLKRARDIGLDPNKDLFSPENQDKLAILLINGGGYKAWKSGSMTTEKFAYNLAGTWRGLPEGPSNLTYQDRFASGNKAHTTWDHVMSVLSGSKTSGSVASGTYGNKGGSLGLASTGDETTYQSGAITQIPDPGGSDYGYYNPAGPGSRKRGPHGVAGEKGMSGHIPAQGHSGEDYANPTGTPLGINEPGKIVDVNTDGRGGGYGNFLAIKLNNGSFLKLSHLNSVYAKMGQDVGGGTVVGTVGSTGLSDGPHLHLDYARKYTKANARVDQTMNPKRITDKLGLGKATSRPALEKHWKGGYTKGYRHQAWLGERGKEFVMDADSTAAMDNVFPHMLKQLNRGNYAQTVALLRSWPQYASQAGQKVDLSNSDKELLLAQGSKQIVPVLTGGGSGRGGGDPMAALVFNA